MCACYVENLFHFYEGINKFMETTPHPHTDIVSLDFPGGIYKDTPFFLKKPTHHGIKKTAHTQVIFFIKTDERKDIISVWLCIRDCAVSMKI